MIEKQYCQALWTGFQAVFQVTHTERAILPVTQPNFHVIELCEGTGIHFRKHTLTYKHTHTHIHIHTTYSALSLPLVNCHQPVPPEAGVQISLWPGQRSLRHACLWSRTWLHLAAHSGSWHNPAWGAGSWCQSQQPHGRSTEELPGWRSQCSAAAGFLCNPKEHKHDNQNKLTRNRFEVLRTSFHWRVVCGNAETESVWMLMLIFQMMLSFFNTYVKKRKHHLLVTSEQLLYSHWWWRLYPAGSVS